MFSVSLKCIIICKPLKTLYHRKYSWRLLQCCVWWGFRVLKLYNSGFEVQSGRFSKFRHTWKVKCNISKDLKKSLRNACHAMSWKTCASESSSHSEKKVDAPSLEKKVKLKVKVNRLFPFQKLNPKSKPFYRFYKKCLTFLWAVVFSGEEGRLMIIMWRWFLMMWWWWWGRWIIHLSSKLPQCRQLKKEKRI